MLRRDKPKGNSKVRFCCWENNYNTNCLQFYYNIYISIFFIGRNFQVKLKMGLQQCCKDATEIFFLAGCDPFRFLRRRVENDFLSNYNFR